MRTEEQKLIKESVKVILGGKECEVKPLVIRDATPWRKKFVALFDDVPTLASVTSDNPKEFSGALNNLLTEKPEAIFDLFFEYTKLDKEEIEGVATTQELLTAFEEVFAFEAPFFGAAIKTMVKLQKSIV